MILKKLIFWIICFCNCMSAIKKFLFLHLYVCNQKIFVSLFFLILDFQSQNICFECLIPVHSSTVTNLLLEFSACCSLFGFGIRQNVIKRLVRRSFANQKNWKYTRFTTPRKGSYYWHSFCSSKSQSCFCSRQKIDINKICCVIPALEFHGK